MDFGVSEESLESSLRTGVVSLLYLTQSLLEEQKKLAAENRRNRQKIRLFHFFPTDPQHAQPQHAAIAGFIRSLSAEHPQFVCRNIELQGDGLTTLTPDDIAVRIFVELQDVDAGNVEIRYIAGRRQVRKNEALALSQADRLNLKPDGVYVITGGCGGLGSIFAQHLARQLKARLALVGRSPLGAVQEEQIRLLEPLAGEVAYFQADIGNSEDVGRLMQEIRSHFGRIDGVIHCAGVLRDSPIAAKSAQERARRLR
ncbi:MAG: SDR family NAD(P)-dependent oxidoreductase [Nitrospira sp.]|nr:SDR family NAD(P)-dependent oxidoreductase [Nitrospira sp.]